MACVYEPFHLKDFQSVFSVIDPATLSGMVVHSGAYPARLGDRLSGVVELQPLHAHGAPQGEVSLSLFNVAALHARGLGSGRGALQLSARRSVYDQLLRWFDSSGSEPGYAEGLARARWQWNATVGVTAGVLAFSDDVSSRIRIARSRRAPPTVIATRGCAWTLRRRGAGPEASRSPTSLWRPIDPARSCTRACPAALCSIDGTTRSAA